MSNRIVQFKKNGVVKKVKRGYSWTTLLFAGIPQLFFRGEYVLGISLFVLTLIFAWIPCIIWSFCANKHTARKLAADGWVIQNTDNPYTKIAAIQWGIEL